MRAVLQRVSSASVVVDDREVGAIDRGLLVFLAVAAGDDQSDLDWLVGKVARQRLFTDQAGRMNRDCAALGGSFLVVSQFTLLATTAKGNRPGFPHGAEPQRAEELYEAFAQRLQQQSGCPVATGRFAAHMQVALCNDGPVTIIIDSKIRE